MESLAELVQFKPDTYGVRWNRHLALFITTDEGVILVDPIGQNNPKAPLLVKECIAQVTAQPVKYVIYSHWGADHGMGGDAFADTATFVGHVNTVERIKATVVQQEKEAVATKNGENETKLATAFYTLKNYAKAAEAAQRAVAEGNSRRPDDAGMLLGVALAQQKKGGEAKKAFAAAAAMNNGKCKDIANVWSSFAG